MPALIAALCLSPTIAWAGDLFWADASLVLIKRSDLDGSNVQTVGTPANTPNGVAVDEIGGHLYWIECCGIFNSRIVRSDLDGGNPVEVLAQADVTSGNLGFPERIAVDGVGGKMYWTDSSSNVIRRADLDGSNAEDIAGAGRTLRPVGIALDVAAGKVYWTETNGTATGFVGIHRANLDGSNAEALYTDGLGDVAASPSGLALDPAGGKMYWTDFGTDEIRRANLDGSGSEVLADNAGQGLVNPTGIAVDPAAGRLYWSDTTLDVIRSSNLDGSGVTDVVTTGLSFPRALAVLGDAVPGVPALDDAARALVGVGLAASFLWLAGPRRRDERA